MNRVPIGWVTVSGLPWRACFHEIEIPSFFHKNSSLLHLHSKAPKSVPNVFVMTSVIPESLVGINACRISIVRLIVPPSRIVKKTG